MASEREVTWTDIERAARLRDPQLADLVIRYMDQPDPPEDREEDADASASVPALPRDAWTLKRLRNTVGAGRLTYKPEQEQRSIRRSSWDALMSAAHPPPRLRLGELLVELYEAGDEPALAALEQIFTRARVGWGLWQALKRIYKLAEERHDAAMFGVLAWRLDAMSQTPTRTGEISPGTFLYMQRRAWRYLRELGRAVPEAYPQFAVQVLRRYPRSFNFWSSWVASQIWGHGQLLGQGRGGMGRPPADPKVRAYPEAWKLSPDPLLRLLEDADNNEVCQFAIRCITADFPERLRAVEPAWLARLGSKPLASVHDFVAKLLRDDPRFHPSKLAGLGLHDLVVSLLRSESNDARKFAVEYARSHAPDLSVALLVELATEGPADVRKLAAERLAPRDAKDLGLLALARLLGASETASMAEKKIKASFSPDEIDAESFIVLWTGNRSQQKFITKLYGDAKKQIPAQHWLTLLEDKRLSSWKQSEVLRSLGRYPGSAIGMDWIKQGLLDRRYTDWVGRWLKAGMFKGDALDVDWVKGLVMRPRLRSMALEVLGNPKLVAPARIGLPWLLALVRQADQSLHQFAHRYMLEHFSPKDFGATAGGAGLDKLYSLLAGPDEPETVRAFAATYLRVHHPTAGPLMPEARDYGIKPRLDTKAYAQHRVAPLFDDPRADVRRVAQDLARHEMVRWGDMSLPYRLAHSRHREARAAAGMVLLRLGQPEGTEDAPPPEWLLADEVFMLAESTVKSTREVGLTLIRRSYDKVGGALRLAWLMESPDREVRLFAVRLLWEKHRPGAFVPPPRPVTTDGEAEAEAPVETTAATRRFDTTEALREFLRTVLFGLPPGRMERREHQGDELPDRPLPASVAKARLIDVVRDFSVDDVEFAQLALPVLESFALSEGKAERNGCVSALATIRQAHPSLTIDLAPGTTPVRAPRRPRFGVLAS